MVSVVNVSLLKTGWFIPVTECCLLNGMVGMVVCVSNLVSLADVPTYNP
jgi:hypothetical protein